MMALIASRVSVIYIKKKLFMVSITCSHTFLYEKSSFHPLMCCSHHKKKIKTTSSLHINIKIQIKLRKGRWRVWLKQFRLRTFYVIICYFMRSTFSHDDTSLFIVFDASFMPNSIFLLYRKALLFKRHW